jgi:hypothetical protein
MNNSILVQSGMLGLSAEAQSKTVPLLVVSNRFYLFVFLLLLKGLCTFFPFIFISGYIRGVSYSSLLPFQLP